MFIHTVELLDVPPGFERGVSFEKKSVDKVSSATQLSAPGGVIDLRDIMTEDDDIVFGTEGKSTQDKEQAAGVTGTVSHNELLMSVKSCKVKNFKGLKFNFFAKW